MKLIFWGLKKISMQWYILIIQLFLHLLIQFPYFQYTKPVPSRKTYLSQKLDIQAPNFEGVHLFPHRDQLLQLSDQKLQKKILEIFQSVFLEGTIFKSYIQFSNDKWDSYARLIIIGVRTYKHAGRLKYFFDIYNHFTHTFHLTSSLRYH